MPVGVQVISQKWDDEICLGVMTAIDLGIINYTDVRMHHQPQVLIYDIL